MRPGTKAALTAALYEMETVEFRAARAAHELHFANAQQPLPAGALDLLEALVALQETAARLRRGLAAMADGKAVPA